MLTVTFKSVLFGVATRLGLDPQANLQANQAAALVEYINDALAHAWEHFDWPELMLIEERAYRDTWTIDSGYDAGDQVYYATDSNYYEALVNVSGVAPGTDDTKWQLLTSLDKVIDLDQPGQTPIGTVYDVFKQDPRINKTGLPVWYTLTGDGLQVAPDAPATVWLQFRQRPPEFTSTPWAATTSYNLDDLVYDPATSECYKAVDFSTNVPPQLTPDTWEKIDFPKIFSRYAKAQAHADALLEDGQADKAALAEAKANRALEDEIVKIVSQAGLARTYSGPNTR